MPTAQATVTPRKADSNDEATDGSRATEPHETEAARIGRTEHGGYIIGPDSADPWPAEVWEAIDLKALSEDVDAINAAVEAVPAAKRDALAASSGFVFSDTERQMLQEIDAGALESLDR